MGRAFLIGAQMIATLLFVTTAQVGGGVSWLSWAAPLILLLLLVLNSFRFTRLVSWAVFAGAFFCLLVVLSAFTLRWRLEGGFGAAPFYKAMLMYTAMVYASLAQIKLNGRRA